MDRFALIANGLVSSVVLWDGDVGGWQPPRGNFAVKCADEVAPGWSYKDGAFLSPPLPERPAIEKTQFSPREFRSRITLEEQMAIRAASLEDMESGLVYDAFNAADYIDVNDPDTAAGIDLYISKGLIQADRREDLLAVEVISESQPVGQLKLNALSEEIHAPS
ncbi:MAG: hypothetical protein QHC88_13090 [Achromobacter sp.]|uniref:hypothetical protein n=1 Tax=Achromobacter sp. TaxID=134375 RepID=UPI0029AEC292|nr:hypothetical protein [Achromobacter sp.]MDX3986180.1 hypothetical protein [Achromobacter sp.]